MSNNTTGAEAAPRTQIQFDCVGTATGKMRNELNVVMSRPSVDGPWELASDEGAFHGGDGSAPPPLALFVAGLTGCIMTQMRAFAKRLSVSLDDLKVETRVVWDWQAAGRIYETAPHSFEIDILLTSSDDASKVVELIEAAKKGCFLEQTLGTRNVIKHRLKTADGWLTV